MHLSDMAAAKDKDKDKDKEKGQSKTVATNRRARYDYFIQDEIEAGMVLTGTEVKSLRSGRANINDSYAGEMQEEMWVFNIDIPVYEGGNRFNHEPRRPRKLLMHAKQIKKLRTQLRTKGVTLIPLSLYFNSRGIAKIKIGLAKGKKEFEKRDVIHKRDWDREKSTMLKNRNK